MGQYPDASRVQVGSKEDRVGSITFKLDMGS